MPTPAGMNASITDTELARLDDKHRLVFVLRDVEGWSGAETAAALNLRDSNVKMRLLRAWFQLREVLTPTLDAPAPRLERSHQHHA